MKMPEMLKIKLKIPPKAVLRAVVAICGAVTFLFFQPVLVPIVRQLVGQAALFSTAITLPQGTLASLRDRFAGDTLPPEDNPPAVSPAPVPPDEAESLAPQPPESTAPGPEPVRPGSPQGKPPQIPKKYQGPLVTAAMLGEEGNPSFLHKNNLWLRNYTKMKISAIEKVLETDCSLQVGDSAKPQVLIYHTHTTESYEEYDNTVYDTRNSWRDTDNTNNMAAVGELLAEKLESYGISVLHDTTQHDQPAYNGAYDRSRKTMEDYLEKYPSIVVTIDLHRDGIVQTDNTVIKPVVEIAGKKAAQLMMIAPCDDGSVGVPGWKENLRFAAELQESIDNSVPNLCRPIFFCYRNYNLGLTGASLLFELGTNGNTMDEALYTAELIAEPIANVLAGHQKS